MSEVTTGGGWRPIETAPKDGQFVLLWCGDSLGDIPRVGNWVEANSVFVDEGYGPPESGWWDLEGRRELKPLHWLPLPDAPKE